MNAADATPWPLDIAIAARNQVDMNMKDRRPAAFRRRISRSINRLIDMRHLPALNAL